METRSLIFDIQRTDDAEWLTQLREEAEAGGLYSEDDLAEIGAAIDLRFNQLNLRALSKTKEG